MNNKIWLCLPHIGGNEVRDVKLAYDSKSVTLLEPNVDGFETAFEKYISDNGRVASSLF